MNLLKTMLPLIMLFVFASCGGKQSAETIAKKWCSLTAQLKSAASDAEKDKAREARKAYEREIEGKYKSDEAFMSKLKDLTRGCDN